MDVVCTVICLLNRLPSRVLNFDTLLQTLARHTHLPSVLMLPLKVFGSIAYVHLHKNMRTKLDPCVIRYVFLWYRTQKKRYWCYDLDTRRLYTTMDVIFLELKMFFTNEAPYSFLQGERLSEEKNWIPRDWLNWGILEISDTDTNNLKQHTELKHGNSESSKLKHGNSEPSELELKLNF